MPLGGSITFGVRSSDGNGYRKWLRNMLVADGYKVKMIGSRRSGSMTGNDNEGWRGFRVDEIMMKAKISVPLLQPNLITINAGSNDCIQELNMEGFGQRVDTLLENVWAASPGSTIILSTLLRSMDPRAEAQVLHANEQLCKLGEQKLAEHKRIVVVDMHGLDGPQDVDIADGTHPNDSGYHKMAHIWFCGIQEAASRKFLQAPRPLEITSNPDA